MATIAIADFLILTDSIAAQFDLYKTNIATDPGGAKEGTNNNLQTVLGLGNVEQEQDLLNAAEANDNQAKVSGAAIDLHSPLIRALSSHVGGFNAYILLNTSQVAPEFKEIQDLILADDIDKANVCSPVVDMGTWEPDGAGAGVFTDENAIDNVLYPDAETEAIVLDLAIGAVALSMDVSFLTDGGGGPFIVPVAFAALDPIGTIVAITPGTKYSNVSLIVVGSAGDGNATDKVRVRSKRVRALVL